MKSIKSLYLYVSTLMFVVAILFSASTVDATCFTCLSTNSNCPDASTCGMTACEEGEVCDLYGSICGVGCNDPGEGG